VRLLSLNKVLDVMEDQYRLIQAFVNAKIETMN